MSFEFAPNGGNWSWNYTNIGYYYDTYGNEQWYYKLIDNSYFCLMNTQSWNTSCNPYFDYMNASESYAHRRQWFDNYEWWGFSNYRYDPYGTYAYDSNY